MTDWNASPRDAVWFSEVIFETDGGEIDHNYGYCSADEYPSPTLLCGPGVVLHSVRVNNVKTGEVAEDWELKSSKTPYGE